jgi:hypothetical protein
VIKLDAKAWLIISLGVLLIINILINQRNKVDYKKEDITKLHHSNDSLIRLNDSIRLVNNNLDKKILEIETNIISLNKTKKEIEVELEKLKKSKNETATRINALSASDVSIAFSEYLEVRAKSKNSN